MNAEQIAKLKELAQAAENEVIRSHGWAGSVEMLETLRIDEEYLIAASPSAILELITLAERTTAPVSLTDERIMEIAAPHLRIDITDMSDEWLQDCRAKFIATVRAILAAAPAPIQKEPAFDMLSHLRRQRDFSEKTFGPGLRTKGVCDHIRKELAEIESDPHDLMEWIDVVILALDGAWRCGGTHQQIIDGIVAKQTKNEGRVWPDWRTADPNKAIEHDRSHDATPAVSQSQAAGDMLQPDDLKALQRFFECCEDFDSGGHDVNKERMARLRELGVIQSKGFGRDQITSFGDYVLCLATNTKARFPLKTFAEYNEDSRLAHEAKLAAMREQQT